MTTNTVLAAGIRGSSGTSLVSPGCFGSFKEVNAKNRYPARIRKLTVLMGLFNFDQPGVEFNHISHFGWGSIENERMPLLTFRLQIGANMFYWLANPSDRKVWKVLDEWNVAHEIVAHAVFKNTAVFMHRPFRISPPLAALRRWTLHEGIPATASFVKSAAHQLDGQLVAKAKSDIPGVPRLDHVSACILCPRASGAPVSDSFAYRKLLKI